MRFSSSDHAVYFSLNNGAGIPPLVVAISSFGWKERAMMLRKLLYTLCCANCVLAAIDQIVLKTWTQASLPNATYQAAPGRKFIPLARFQNKAMSIVIATTTIYSAEWTRKVARSKYFDWQLTRSRFPIPLWNYIISILGCDVSITPQNMKTCR